MTTATEKKLEIMPEIIRKGNQFIMPENMTEDEGIKWLTRKKEENNRQVEVNEIIPCHPLEGAVALAGALKQRYGWTELVPTPGFFGAEPPQYISLEVGPNTMIQVPWGSMVIPGIKGRLETTIDKKDGQFIFKLTGIILQRHKEEIFELMNDARERFRTNSIYRGQAVRVSFPEPSGRFNLRDNCPTFVDLSNVNEEELIFDEETRALVETNLFTPIEFTQHCRDSGIPLKRGVLLEGKYGTGKTLTAKVAAKLCRKHGWTFIYLSSVTQLKDAVLFSKNYLPAVIFAEDIDQAIGTQDRTGDVNDILNNIDGVDSKNDERIVVLTTNHVTKINKAMMRPGRLDAVIEIKPPDADAVAKLIRLYGRHLIGPNANLSRVGEMLAGQIPATIREVTERAKLAGVRRTRSSNFELTGDDLVLAATGMQHHLRLQEEAPDQKASVIQQFAQHFGREVTESCAAALKDMGILNPTNKAKMIELLNDSEK